MLKSETRYAIILGDPRRHSTPTFTYETIEDAELAARESQAFSRRNGWRTEPITIVELHQIPVRRIYNHGYTYDTVVSRES